MLQLDRLRYEHPNQPGYDFSLVAAPGEVTAITGPSGSGKSTLLDLIAGFLAPTAGAVRLDGEIIGDQPPEARPISILFQTENLFDHLSAARNVALGLPSGTPREQAQARIAVALAEVGLPDVGNQRASTLSGGQKQRVALARTLLRNRRVLLLDEPFSALDASARQSVRDLVRQLTRERNWITLLVSHDAEDVAALASRRYELNDGRLELWG